MQIRIKYKILISLALCFATLYRPSSVHGQESSVIYKSLWTGLSAEYEFNKAWSIQGEQELRFSDITENYSSSISNLNVRYRVNKFISFNVQYRYAKNNHDWDLHRYAFDTRLKWKIPESKFKLKYRLRFQDSFVQYTGQKKTYLRNKLGLEYKITKRLKPFVAYENFFRFNLKDEIRFVRYTLGVNWELMKNLELECFLRYEENRNQKLEISNQVSGIQLHYKF